jgi:Rieske Fe-S protein
LQKVKIFLAVDVAVFAISAATPAIATVRSPAGADIPAGHAVQDATGLAPAEVDKYVLAGQFDRNTHWAAAV